MKDICRCRQPQRKLAARDFPAKPKGAGRVAKAVVPFQPAVGELAQLVATLANVPGLGDELHCGQHGVLRQRLEQRAVPVEPSLGAAQHGCQVKTKAVHVHVLNPVAQAVQHKLHHARVRHVQRIAATREVLAVLRRVRRMAIPTAAVQAAPTDRGPVFIALGRVVVDHVKNDLDALGVQGSHHLAKLVTRGLPGGRSGIAWVRAEKAQGVVTPMVNKAVAHQPFFAEMLMHRQQAHGGHAQSLQVGQGRG